MNFLEKLIKNYSRDIARFRKAARQWPNDRVKYTTAANNLQTVVDKAKARLASGHRSL